MVSELTEYDIGRRIAVIEARCFPSVMIWDPATSASGAWEAMGGGWLIKEKDPAGFYRLLREKLGIAEDPAVAVPRTPATAGPAGDSSPGESPAGSETAEAPPLTPGST